MEENQIKTGDVVRLKHEGDSAHYMSVGNVNDGIATCYYWVNESGIVHKEIPVIILEVYVPDNRW